MTFFSFLFLSYTHTKQLAMPTLATYNFLSIINVRSANAPLDNSESHAFISFLFFR
jgi:hypothetical protein